jgi:hypothetical protein
MSYLRQRPTPLEKSTEATRVRGPQQYKAPKTTSQQLFLIFLIPLAIPVFFLWPPFQRHLSLASYALCSRNGTRIYTVDAMNTKVQCAVIHNSKFVDVGPLCESPGPFSKSQPMLMTPFSRSASPLAVDLLESWRQSQNPILGRKFHRGPWHKWLDRGS